MRGREANKKPRLRGAFYSDQQADARDGQSRLALACLVALLGLVDDVYAAFAANELVVTMTLAQALEAVPDLHRRLPVSVQTKRGKPPYSLKNPPRVAPRP